MYNPDLEFAAPKIPPEIRQKARGNPGTQWTNPDNNRTYELSSNGRWRNVSKGQKPASAPKAKAKSKVEQKAPADKAPAAKVPGGKGGGGKDKPKKPQGLYTTPDLDTPEGRERERKYLDDRGAQLNKVGGRYDALRGEARDRAIEEHNKKLNEYEQRKYDLEVKEGTRDPKDKPKLRPEKSIKPLEVSGDDIGKSVSDLLSQDESFKKPPKRKVNKTWTGQGQKSPKPKPKPTRSPYGKGFKPSESDSRSAKLEDLAQRLLSGKHGSYEDILADLDKVVSPKKEDQPEAPTKPATPPTPELAPDEPDEYDPPEVETGPEPAKAPRAPKAPKAPKASPAQQKFLDQVAKHDGPIQAENGRQRRSLEALVKKGMLTKSGDDYYRPDSPNIPKPETTPTESADSEAKATEPESPGSLATATEPESSPIEKPASGGKSRWNKLIEDIDSYTAKDLELIDQSLALAAKIAPQYVKTLEDAGVSPSPQQSKPKQIEESSSQPKPPRSRFNQLIDDLDELGDESTRALAKGLGTSADMVKTIKDLESRRGSTGAKQLTPQDRALAAAADAEADAAADAAADATPAEYDPNEPEQDVEDGPDVPEGWSTTKPKTAAGQGGLSGLLSGEDVSHEDIDENEAREYLQMLREDRPKPGSKDYKDMVKIREILKKKKGG